MDHSTIEAHGDLQEIQPTYTYSFNLVRRAWTPTIPLPINDYVSQIMYRL